MTHFAVEQPRKLSGLVGSSILPSGSFAFSICDFRLVIVVFDADGCEVLRYFEDVNVGDRFGSDSYLVTEESIIAFAREFDVQPFHIDRAAADASDFGGLAASGWHTAAIAMRLFTTGELQFVGGAIGMSVDELRWPNAVCAGDTLRLETEILEMRRSRSKPNRGILRIRNVAMNQKSEIVLSYVAMALVHCRRSD
jgi:acyl dehydratase